MQTRTLRLTAIAIVALLDARPRMAQERPAADAIKAQAEEAYIYGFPMIVAYKVMYEYNIDRASGKFKAPFNEINNEARVFTPRDTDFPAPNSDTPYSMAQLDLRAEPIVLCMPAIESRRYYDVQLVDMYTHNYGYIGSRASGNGAGCYLVAGPDWTGQAPPGIAKAFRSETQFSLAIYRTQLFDSGDMDNVKSVQAGYKVQSLSAFVGKEAPRPAPAIDWLKFEGEAFSSRFAEYLDFLLQFCPPSGTAAVETPLRERFARIGIGPNRKLDPKSLTTEVKAAMGDAIKDALAKIEATADSLGTRVNGWQIGAAAGSREFYKGNWALRAAAAHTKIGIYGNSEAEAVYPFTRDDVNGSILDGSKRAYQMTFAPGQLPPVNAFWSITMYDGETRLLIDNPINRYLINSAMLPQLKKNADGSLTIYVQEDSPGEDKESNWLPAPNGPMFVAMRLYWPKTEPPSVYPLGKGAWRPAALVPVRNLKALEVTRIGDKSLENLIRTDERYGHDGLFQGPRGWGYWNHLENPKPIQNPNLWPDTQPTYLLSRLVMPAGSSLTLNFTYPRARYFQFALYRWERNTFVATDALAGPEIEPEPGSTNPFRVGANRLLERRDFTLRVLAEAAPADQKQRARNTVYTGKGGGQMQAVVRIYLPDQGSDGAGWGPADSSWSGRGLPTYSATLADGTKLSAAQVVKQFARPITGATQQPISAEQWATLVHAKDNDPTLDPATAPARKDPKWEKFWTLNYSVVGVFKTPDARAKIPYAGAMEGGGDPLTQYSVTYLSRQFGAVYVMRGKMPTFPDTYAGVGGRGLEVMPDAQTQYWSLVSCEAAPSGQIVDGLTDMQVPLDADRNYTIVVSPKEDRPKNATFENGVAWMEWSSRGEGIDGPQNRADFGMLMLRIMANNPTWTQSPDKVTRPGMEEAVMGPYYPHGHYTTKAEFEATGRNK